MVLGIDFGDIMDYDDIAAEKCGYVVEMWLGMLDIANMAKSQIQFMEREPIQVSYSLDWRHRSTFSIARQDQQPHPTPRGTAPG